MENNTTLLERLADLAAVARAAQQMALDAAAHELTQLQSRKDELEAFVQRVACHTSTCYDDMNGMDALRKQATNLLQAEQ